MNVTVVGAGGVGAYFGGRLAQAGADVTFIARGAHLEAMQARGLRVDSVLGDFVLQPVRATDDPSDAPAADVVLFCVKSFDTDAAARLLPALLAPDGSMLTLQNGVDNGDRLGAVVGDERVLVGAAFIFSTISEPGVVRHSSGPARIVFGERLGAPTARCSDLLSWFERASVDASLSDDMPAVLWNKFAFICAQSGVTAASRAPIGRLLETPESRDVFRALSQEVCAVARAEGVALAADATDQHLAFAERLDPNSYSSLHHDLVHHKRLELDALHGTVLQRARRRGVKVPHTETIYGLLKPWIDGADHLG